MIVLERYEGRDEKVRKTMKMENKRSHDGPSLKQLT